MTINLEMLLQSTVPLLTLIGGLIAWGWLRLDRKFDKIDQQYDKIEKKLDAIITKLDNMNDRLTRLEVRVEERTLRVIHTGHEQKIV